VSAGCGGARRAVSLLQNASSANSAETTLGASLHRQDLANAFEILILSQQSFLISFRKKYCGLGQDGAKAQHMKDNLIVSFCKCCLFPSVLFFLPPCASSFYFSGEIKKRN